ncbi:MAG: anthranilate synthase component I family protein, partial [Planctomycetaceae bacterium]|nr:anthranilate synthase component I family protein [Planctomycetaceae bacterium]
MVISPVTDSVYIEDLLTQPSLSDVLSAFDDQSHLLVLHSGGQIRLRDCRYSILTAAPVEVVRMDVVQFGDEPFRMLREWQKRLPNLRYAQVPPFCGGIAGLLSYEVGEAFERLPHPPHDPMQTPALLAGLFDWAIVWDHLDGTVRLFVLSLTGTETADSEHQRRTRINWVHERLNRTMASGKATNQSIGRQHPHFRSNFTREAYITAIERVIEYIRAGDIFQANLSQQLQADWKSGGAALFQSVCLRNPAPFSGLLQAEDFAVVSASPERFLKVDQGRFVEARPIKGTRRRQQSPIADLFTADELSASEKDRAENVMIVDLLRNDISRSCRPGSVRVTGVCEIEVFETVQHLVSTVVGELRADCDVWDLLQGAFPGGSITGAPKIRAMQIIAELEQSVRGAYCGSLFYSGPRG